MRSSTARALSQIKNSSASHDAENDPLLDASDGEQGHDLESVYVDPQPAHPPRLVDVLHERMQQVDALQPVAEAKVKRRVSQVHLYSFLLITGLVTLVTSPSSGFYFLWKYFYSMTTDRDQDYRLHKGLLPEHEASLSKAKVELASLQDGLERDQTTRDQLLMPYYKQWFNYDAENTNCDIQHDRHPEEGRAALERIIAGRDHPWNWFFSEKWPPNYSGSCQKVLSQGRRVENENYELLDQIAASKGHIESSQYAIDNLTDQISIDKLWISTGEKNGMLVAGTMVGVCAFFVLIGSLFLGNALLQSRRRAYENLDVAKQDLKTIAENIDDGLLTQLEALPVSLNLQAAVVLTELRQELALRIDEAELRARKRAAFLSGKKYPESGLFGFLTTAGSKETSKIIFQHAELLPRP